jgi:hypothetical protein
MRIFDALWRYANILGLSHETVINIIVLLVVYEC